MTVDQIVADVCGRMNLVSDEAKARVLQSLNRHLRRVTTSIGLDTTRSITVTATTALGSDRVTFATIEKIDRVFERGTDNIVRVLQPMPLAQIREGGAGVDALQSYAVLHQTADAVTIILAAQALVVTTLYADGVTSLAALTGTAEPPIPASYHDILTFEIVAEEYLRKGNTDLADRFKLQADALLKELRFQIADAPAIDFRQGDHVIPGAGGATGAGQSASTITGDITFDRDPGPPFHVTPGSGLVDNLDADKLDGQHGAFYQDASNLNAGTIPPARIGADSVGFDKLPNVAAATLLGRGSAAGAGDAQEIALGSGLALTGTTLTALPQPAAAHHATHEAGGTDAIKLDDLAAPDDTTDLDASAATHGLLRKLSGVATQFLNGVGAWVAPLVGLHAPTHSSAGTDPVDVKALGGYPGGTAGFLRADATFAVPPGGGAGGVPGGADTQLQFNDAGTFGGALKAFWNKATNRLTLGGELLIQKDYPALTLVHQSAPADQRAWNVASDGLGLHMQSINDAGAPVQSPLIAFRNGDVNIAGKLLGAGGVLALGVDPVEGAGNGAVIRRTTADGADTGYIILGGGGGAVDTGRGSRVVVFGNEAAAPGSIAFYPGDVLVARIAIKDSLGNDALSFRNDDKILLLTRPANKVGAPPTFANPNLSFDLMTGVAFLSPGTAGVFSTVFVNPPPTGVEFVFSIQYDISAACTPTFPASVTWDEDVPPVFPGAGRTIILGFSTITGGARWRGYIGGRNFLT